MRGTCTVPNCNRPLHSHGLCNSHYHRVRSGKLSADVPLREWGRDICSVPDCGRPHATRGLCSGHYQRLLSSGDVRQSEAIGRAVLRRKLSLADRFWLNVTKLPGDDACWLWTGYNVTGGYGRIRFQDKDVLATHAAWFLVTGTWPEKQMLHTCDNPPCVRSDVRTVGEDGVVRFGHLFEGTEQDNVDDMIRKGRAWWLKATKS